MITLRTKDIDEAAYWWTHKDISFAGVSIRPADGKSKRKVYFLFKVVELSEENVEQIKNDFMNDKALVNPRTFSQKQNDVRSQLRESLYRDELDSNKSI